MLNGRTTYITHIICKPFNIVSNVIHNFVANLFQCAKNLLHFQQSFIHFKMLVKVIIVSKETNPTFESTKIRTNLINGCETG